MVFKTMTAKKVRKNFTAEKTIALALAAEHESDAP